jgi:hypothetical protein
MDLLAPVVRVDFFERDRHRFAAVPQHVHEVVRDRLRQPALLLLGLPGRSFTITCGMASASSVLLVGDVFDRIDSLGIELLLEHHVRHRDRWIQNGEMSEWLKEGAWK